MAKDIWEGDGYKISSELCNGSSREGEFTYIMVKCYKIEIDVILHFDHIVVISEFTNPIQQRGNKVSHECVELVQSDVVWKGRLSETVFFGFKKTDISFYFRISAAQEIFFANEFPEDETIDQVFKLIIYLLDLH